MKFGSRNDTTCLAMTFGRALYANIDAKTVKFVIGDATDQKDVIFIINPPLGGLVGNAGN